MEQVTRTIQPEAGWKKKTALFLSSQSVSLFGSMLVQYAIIWYVTLSTHSGTIMTISTVAAFLPQIIISPFAGVWADRYQRKFLIIFADVLTATSTLLLAGFFLLGYRELWLIFLVSGIRSVGAGIQTPAVNALLPQLVPSERLLKVNSLNSTLQPIIMITAPVASGVLLSFSRIETIFLVDVITAALAVGLLLTLRVQVHQKATQPQSGGYLDDLKAGLASVRQNREIRTLFIFFAFVFFLVVPVAFLSPLLVTRSFGDEVWRLTANEVTFFGGSILGGVVLTVWGGFKNHFRTIALACVVWAFLMVGLGSARGFIAYLVIMFLTGIPMPFWQASTTTLLQQKVQADMHGRVFGLLNLIMNTVMPLGMLIFGPVADFIPIESLLILTGALMLVPGLWLLASRRTRPSASSRMPAELESQPGD